MSGEKVNLEIVNMKWIEEIHIYSDGQIYLDKDKWTIIEDCGKIHIRAKPTIEPKGIIIGRIKITPDTEHYKHKWLIYADDRCIGTIYPDSIRLITDDVLGLKKREVSEIWYDLPKEVK